MPFSNNFKQKSRLLAKEYKNGISMQNACKTTNSHTKKPKVFTKCNCKGVIITENSINGEGTITGYLISFLARYLTSVYINVLGNKCNGK